MHFTVQDAVDATYAFRRKALMLYAWNLKPILHTQGLIPEKTSILIRKID
jgi:hypothetical protein